MTIDEAISILKQYVDYDNPDVPDFYTMEEAIKVIIEVLEQEPKTGRWIKTISENGVTSAIRCSECGFEDNRYMLFRYCPSCGAKMKEGD